MIRAAASLLLLLPALCLAQADGGRSEVAQPLDLKARVVPDKVLLGDPFVYELVVTHLPKERWELAAPADLGAFEFVDQARSRTDGKDSSVTTFKIKLQLFELGAHQIPDLTFTVADEQGARKFVAKGLTVEALSTLPKDAEEKGEALYAQKPNAEVAVRSWTLVWVLLGVLAAAALGYAAYKYLTRPKPPPAIPAAPPKPLNVRTLEALDALKAEDLPGKGRPREFYFRLSEIVRGYLGERFSFEALECTGSELLAAARGFNADGLSIDALSRFVQDSDLAKFAKAEPTPDACAASLQYAYRLVHDTSQPQPNAPRPAVP